ncbi:hypothetical protein [Enterococcus camelliae]|uniref:Uncharacterized protein n=1 Tax=Enterococcus camelliae TaxID=453959 RepID=A0ABW5TME1_9ENTE
MKKKQLAKLKQQFRPSFGDARQQLFQKMEEKAQEEYRLSLRVFLNPQEKNEMRIELLQPTTRDQQIKVPLDENFITVVKRIQKGEQGLLDRFSSNLVEEVASYWVAEQEQVSNETTTTTIQDTTEQPADSLDESKGTKTRAFIEEIERFPKFAIEDTDEALIIYEKTSKEKRLLASVSKLAENKYTIEPALDRKYKLKLEVIPIIEAFAAVPLVER